MSNQIISSLDYVIKVNKLDLTNEDKMNTFLILSRL